MKKLIIPFCILFCFDAFGAGFLKAESFPKGFQDLSFVQKVQVLKSGYEDWESEYDASGVCIKNCAYKGVTLQEDLDRMNAQTGRAIQKFYSLGYPVGQNTNLSQQVDMSDYINTMQTYYAGECSPRNPYIKPGQTEPFGYPLIEKAKITSPYGYRKHPISGNNSLHKGVDLSAKEGTNVFAPASAIVKKVWSDSDCGNGLVLQHSNGFETLYCHLSGVTVKEGDNVQAGCLIAKTGNTGKSTGPHLHYAIKDNGEYIDPTRTLR